MRTVITEGVYIDFYNLHADACTESGDESSCQANLEEIVTYIDTWSIGDTIVLYGDTNSRYTRSLDNITTLENQNGLTDAFVEIQRTGVNPTVEADCDNPSLINTCETVDEGLYRSSKALTLDVTYFNYESRKFLQSDRNVLSDHNPITVNFTWAVSSSFRKSGFGMYYTDLGSTTCLPSLRRNRFLCSASAVHHVSISKSETRFWRDIHARR